MQLEILFCDCLLYINYEGLIYVIWSDHPPVPDRGNYYRWRDRGSDRWIFLSCSAYLCLTVLFRGEGSHVLVVLSQFPNPCCPALAVLPWLSCPVFPVLAVLFWRSCSCFFFSSFPFSDILVPSLFVSLLSLRFFFIHISFRMWNLLSSLKRNKRNKPSVSVISDNFSLQSCA